MNSAIYAVMIAFVVNIILCPVVIPWLHRLKFGQNVRDDGPKTHLKKAGTPTMGGIMILLSFILASVIFLKDNREGIMVIFVTLGFGLIGFADDYIKVVKKRSLGLRAGQKIVAQFIVSGIFVFFLYKFAPQIMGDAKLTEVIIPFTQNKTLDLGIFYIPFIFFVIIAVVNAVNLTDGLDGLDSGVTALVVTFFAIIAWVMNSKLLPISGAALGSLLGFLLFNSYPAKVFMGDTGSLALGGYVVAVAILLRMPLFIPIVGIIYVIEALSVVIQVGYFKLTKQRFFKMAPIHHSFEISGWPETKVVTLFYIITALFCLIGFLAAEIIK